LCNLQRLAGSAIMRPLDAEDAMQRTWVDGRAAEGVMNEFIKPNDRLTALERIEIYNRQYWFRLIDCLYEDYPGLRAVVGEEAFHRIVRGYLEANPSRSFTLRNLGKRLPAFLREHPALAGERQEIAVEMAGFEWAQVVAFDSEAKSAIGSEDLQGTDAATLRLGIQPYVTLLELGWPLDDFSIALKKRGVRGEASNAVDTESARAVQKRVRMPKRERVYVAVHRWENLIYYKRLERDGYRILMGLREGLTVAEACMAAIGAAENPKRNWERLIKGWFEVWTRMGWFYQRK
jgi:hypothetical protein